MAHFKLTRANFFTGLAMLVFSALIGGSLAIYNLRHFAKNGDFMIQNGCWRVNPVMDLSDHYQRALIAMVGLFALRESEVLYFVASEDSDGQPLSADYDYLLEGPAPDARYWSYTLYGADYFLVKNDAGRYGFNLDNIAYEQSDLNNPEMPENDRKNHQIYISSTPKEKNWLPAGNEKRFHLTLRMYNPSPAVYEHLGTVPLPVIRRLNPTEH